MEKMLQRASAAGILGEDLKELREMVTNFDDIFRLRFGLGPPAKVERMKEEVVANARPVQAKQRRYPPTKTAFLNRVVDKLQEYRFIKLTTEVEGASAPLIVPKPPPANFRMGLDLQNTNAVTKLLTWPMPNLESEMADVRKRRSFASSNFPWSF